MKQKVRILIVDDSQLVREILKDIFAEDPELEVVGEAVDGREAIDLTKKLKPGIITMDIQMPVMDGFEATEHIMAYAPTPILIFSSAIDKSEQYTSFKAISLGALDNMSKPDITREGFESLADTLRTKVKMLSRIKVIPHIRGKLKNGDRKAEPVEESKPLLGAEPPETPKPGLPSFSPGPVRRGSAKYGLVAIGASTGGPMALQKILSRFSSGFPAGIVVVQHISRGFIDSFVEWLDTQTQLNIKIARNGEPVTAGTVYFAPDNVHIEVTSANRIMLNQNSPAWKDFKPSVNHLFQAVAENMGNRAIGVILTGMGSDGAIGMEAMYGKGAYTIAQDRETSLIFGMPKASIDNNCVCSILPLDKIADEIYGKLQE